MHILFIHAYVNSQPVELLAALGACPIWDLELLDSLISELHFEAMQFTTVEDAIAHPYIWDLMSNIIALLPQKLPKVFSLNSIKGDIKQLTSLFFGQDCKIIKIHKSDTTETIKVKEEGEIYSPRDIPILGSGCVLADNLGRLCAGEKPDFGGATALLKSLDSNTLSKFIKQLNEHNRNPEDRFNEWKGKCFDEKLHIEQEEDLTAYYESLGLYTSEEELLRQAKLEQ